MTNEQEQLKENTIRAIRGSIKHWKENVARVRKHLAPDLSTTDCTLCREFIPRTDGKDSCVKCPIFKKTGKPLCEETPYVEASAMLHLYRRKDSTFSWDNLLDTCLEELKFLQKLLKEVEKQNKKG